MLKPRKRITKKQLKEDKLVTFYFQASDWLQQNSQYLLWGVVALVLVASGAFYYFYTSANAERDASVELAKASRSYEGNDYQNAIAQLSNLVDNYGGTTSGKIGRFYLANSFYMTKDYENAEKNFKKFISGFSGDEHFLAAAEGGLASTLVQRNHPAEAAKAFEKAATRYTSVLAPGFLLQAGRCYTTAGDKAKAREMYDKVIKDYPKSTEKEEAVMLESMIFQ
jgi:predicted negative regulator of RcsB-dependent stress response